MAESSLTVQLKLTVPSPPACPDPEIKEFELFKELLKRACDTILGSEGMLAYKAAGCC